jgi:hypothetical protein
MLLGELIVHIAKLLNFDEVARGGGYVGYNGEAIEYWKTDLEYLPITPNLPYPELPHDMLFTLPAAPEPTTPFKRKSVTGFAVHKPLGTPALASPVSGFRKKSVGWTPR